MLSSRTTHGTVHKRALAMICGLALCALGAPATALAAEVHVQADAIVFTAAPGETNSVGIALRPTEEAPNRYIVSDTAPITPGSGCYTEPEYNTTYCVAPAGPLPVRIDLGDMADSGGLSVPGTLAAGAGDDKLSGSSAGPQVLDGGPGNDEMIGDASPYCTAGLPDVGTDTFVGGDGVDFVDYSDQNVQSLAVSIDGIANDGGPGENDNVTPDVENVDGTSCGVNLLTGSGGPNRLRGKGMLNGLGGDDDLNGSGSDDVLNGGDGNDQLHGFGANDTLDGGPGNDFLEGGFDNDSLTGGLGVDSFAGDETASNTIGTGNDTINAQDGVAENVSCGPGSDVANVDASDTVAVDTQNLCEVIKRASGGGPGGGPPGAKPLISLATARLASGRTKVRLTLTCNISAAAGCNGTLKLVAKPKGKKSFALGSKLFSIDPGKKATITLSLSKKNRKALKKVKSIKVLLTATLKTDQGKKTVKVPATLKP